MNDSLFGKQNPNPSQQSADENNTNERVKDSEQHASSSQQAQAELPEQPAATDLSDDIQKSMMASPLPSKDSYLKPFETAHDASAKTFSSDAFELVTPEARVSSEQVNPNETQDTPEVSHNEASNAIVDANFQRSNEEIAPAAAQPQAPASSSSNPFMMDLEEPFKASSQATSNADNASETQADSEPESSQTSSPKIYEKLPAVEGLSLNDETIKQPLTDSNAAKIEIAPPAVEFTLDNQTSNTPQAVEEIAQAPEATPLIVTQSFADEALHKSQPPQDNTASLIAEHQKWLDSAGAEGRRAVFRENLQGVNFVQQRLSGASMRGLQIVQCNFTGAQLNEVDFSEAVLERPIFSNTYLDLANFSNATFTHAEFDNAQMSEVNFSGVQAENTNFSHSKLEKFNARDAVLNHSNFTSSFANNANFRGAQLNESDFSNSDLTHAIFRESQLNAVNFAGAKVEQANFKDAQMAHVNLNATDFSQAFDISNDAHAQFMQSERESFSSEMQKLNQIRDELEKRERDLNAQREALHRQSQADKMQIANQSTPAIDGELANIFKKSGKLFMFFGISWTLLCFFLAFILQNVFSQIDSSELSTVELIIMGAIMIIPLIFFVFSMSKSFSIAYKLRKITHAEPHESL